MRIAFFLQLEYFVNIGIISGTPQVDTIIEVWIDKGIIQGQKGICVKTFHDFIKIPIFLDIFENS